MIFDYPKRFDFLPKWWAVEVRWDRPLSVRELRRAELSCPTFFRGSDALIGVDGFLWDKFDTYPGSEHEGYLREMIRRVQVGARVRAAWWGRDCPGPHTCQFGPGRHRVDCEHGEGNSPVFTDADWVHF